MDYKTLGSHFQIEGDICHLDVEQLNQLRGTNDTQARVSRDDGIQLFNDTAEKLGLHPMKDPKGYMVLDDNVHAYLQDTYRDSYEKRLDEIDNGMRYGSPYAYDAVLVKMNSVIRKDMTTYLPKGVKYGELKTVRATDEVKDAVDAYVADRVEWTASYNLRRKTETSALASQKEQLDHLGSDMGNIIAEKYNQSKSLAVEPIDQGQTGGMRL